MRCSTVVALLIAGSLAGAAAQREAGAAASRPSGTSSRRCAPDASSWFEPNRGQTDSQADFLARCRGCVAFLTKDGATFGTGAGAFRLRFVGADGTSRPRAAEPLAGVSNYLTGSDAAGWTTDVPHVGRVAYDEMLPGVGVDWRTAGHSVAFDLDLAPGTDPASIRLRFEGADDATVDADGSLVLAIPGGRAAFSAPRARQGARDIAAAFDLRADGTVGFRVGAHDPSQRLVIDPTLSVSTYFGGAADENYGVVAVGPSNNLYLAGGTFSTTFPVTTGAYQTAKGDPNPAYGDAFVAKFNAAGTSLSFATFIGGNNHDFADAIAVDGSGNAYFGGSAGSTNFPTVNPYQTTGSGFLAELNAAGNGLVWCTKLSYVPSSIVLDASTNLVLLANDHVMKFDSAGTTLAYDTNLASGTSTVTIHDVAVDAGGSAWAAGINHTSGQATNPSLQVTYAGGNGDGWLVKLDGTGTAVYQTYFGGTGEDRIRSLSFDFAGNLHIAGETNSPDLPTSHAAQSVNGGTFDAFVATLDPSARTILWSTYHGGAASDSAYSVAVNARGETFVAGQTGATGFPLSNASQGTYGGGLGDGVYVTFAADGTLEQASYLGGSTLDFLWKVAVNTNGAAFASGQTDSSNLPTASAYQSSRSGPSDTFLCGLPTPATPYLDTSPVTLPEATLQTSYSGNLVILGGTGAVTWSIYGGSPPNGISLAPNGALSGTPTATGPATFYAMVYDQNHAVTVREFRLTVNPRPAVSTANLPSWTAQRPYNKPLAATGGTVPLTWSLTTGTIPPGASVDPLGAVTATSLTTPGNYQFGVLVTDANGATGAGTVSMTVKPFPRVTSPASSAFAACTQTRPYAMAFTVTDGTGPFTWSVPVGTLPIDTALDSKTGVVDGYVTLAGSHTFTVRATDATGAAADRVYSIDVNAFPVIQTTTLPWGAKDRPYAAPLLVAGGTAPLVWRLTTGSLPAGLSPPMAGGVLAGTPTATGYFGFGLGLSDSCGADAARTLTLGVADFADLKKANARLPVTFTSATGLLPVLRFVELTAGTELSFTVSPKVKGDLPVDVKLYDAAGREFDLSGASTLKKGKFTLRRFAVSLTGRYFLAFRPLLAFDGEVTLQPSASPRSKWAGTVTTDAAGTPQTAKFSALPGSKVAITVRAAKGSAAIPTIVSLKDAAGNELFVGTELKLTKWGATLKPKLPLTGDDYTLTVVPRENSSGAVSWSAALKPPKSYAFTLPDDAQGD